MFAMEFESQKNGMLLVERRGRGSYKDALRMEPRKLRTKNAVIEIGTFHFRPEPQLTKVPNREKVAE
jgi:hypothetical protein